MYIPRHFKVEDETEISDFVAANSFGQLVSQHQGRTVASHLPFLPDLPKERLLCHLARQNPQWQDLADQEILVIFPGPHDYVSPSWYQAPGVPTWNYQAVHIYGHCRVFDDAGGLKQVVNGLTEKHESRFDEPWSLQYKEAMLKAIVGIEIEITDVQCKYKLSQNRPQADQQEAIEKLQQLGADELSAAMRKAQSKS